MFQQNCFLIFCVCVVIISNIDLITTQSAKSINELLKLDGPKDPRVINGTAAFLNATRHQVSIRSKRKDSFFFGTGHLCGGSLISENVVLSAAHCFVNYNIKNPRGTFHPDNYFTVVMGNLDRYDNNNNTLVFNILKVVKKLEIFDLTTYQKDIALVILDGKVPANHPTVRPIILNDGPVKNNTLCHAAGWGAVETESYTESDILLNVDLPIIDFDDCIQKILLEDLVTEGMICAGYMKGEKDVCSGDSGGALVCQGLQTGITSWGLGCAMPLAPGVFTDVAFYKDWILQEVMKNNGTLPKFSGDGSDQDGEENVDGEGDGNGDGEGNRVGEEDKDGVSDLSCSLVLVSSLFVFNFYLSRRN